MAYYLMSFNYSRDSVQALVKNPQDREDAVRKSVEAAGGKLHHLFMALGPTDGYTLCEFPMDIDAVAFGAAVSASGSVTNVSTTKLLTTKEFSESMKRAAKIGSSYSPPKA
jgi:uncharacterized protein with GYD domain